MWPAIVRFDEPTMSQAVDDALTRIVAIVGLFGIALIHILQAPEAFEEIGYLGALFVVGRRGRRRAAAMLNLSADERVLEAAGGLAGLILIGYLVSRIVGLPGATNDVARVDRAARSRLDGRRGAAACAWPAGFWRRAGRCRCPSLVRSGRAAPGAGRDRRSRPVLVRR